MRHSDLGHLDGPVVVFGGPYSNFQATRAVLDHVQSMGAVPICTGDVVAYCARPRDTIAAIRRANCAVVAGNCEQQLATGAPDCGCGFDAGSTCDLLSAGWYGFASAQMQAQDRAWMADLPDVITFTHAGKRCAVIHGGVRDVAQFLWSTSPDAAFEAEWDVLERLIGPVDQIWAGHSGIPFQRTLRRGDWINAGVIGMPPHDGRAATRFAVLEQGRVRICDLDYDAQGAAADMVAAGLTQGYHASLTSGYWPSEDVLPPALRVSALAKG